VETIEFVLEKPVKFKVGDRVRVSYVEKDGKMNATRVVKAPIIQVKRSPSPSRKQHRRWKYSSGERRTGNKMNNGIFCLYCEFSLISTFAISSSE